MWYGTSWYNFEEIHTFFHATVRKHWICRILAFLSHNLKWCKWWLPKFIPVWTLWYISLWYNIIEIPNIGVYFSFVVKFNYMIVLVSFSWTAVAYKPRCKILSRFLLTFILSYEKLYMIIPSDHKCFALCVHIKSKQYCINMMKKPLWYKEISF